MDARVAGTTRARRIAGHAAVLETRRVHRGRVRPSATARCWAVPAARTEGLQQRVALRPRRPQPAEDQDFRASGRGREHRRFRNHVHGRAVSARRVSSSAERAVTEHFRDTLSAAAFCSSHGLLIADKDLLAGDTALTEVLVCLRASTSGIRQCVHIWQRWASHQTRLLENRLCSSALCLTDIALRESGIRLCQRASEYFHATTHKRHTPPGSTLDCRY